MKFLAKIDVMPLANLLDPQGKAVCNSLHHNHYEYVNDVRIGKHIELILESDNEKSAEANVHTICKTMLVNAVMENYHFTLENI